MYALEKTKYRRFPLIMSNATEIIGEGTYTIWQYDERGEIKGINTPVDKCKFNSKYSLEDILMVGE